ncbi:MAG: DUF4942 domain-containing protein [Mycoplasma sp.]|nr:DUF4942 domain-containing protein [Mycoplasma sp.]
MNKLLQELKEKGEDLEWYPTTSEIINCMFNDMVSIRENERYKYRRKELDSILDIGAGDGKVFRELKKLRENYKITGGSGARWDLESVPYKHYAIEKSKTLIDNMDKNIIVIGTDFMEQSLIDKNIDVIFSNPPYSQFVDWTLKILREANNELIYMVIPQRWEENKEIQKLIEKREIEYEILGNFDFLESEDRKARAKVHLIKFEMLKRRGLSSAFGIWFKDHFKIDLDNEKNFKDAGKRKEELESQLINKENIITELVKMYNMKLENFLSNYKSLGELDPDILKELGQNLEGLSEALEGKIKGLKNLFWEMAFDKLESITKRLTKKYRDYILTKLNHQASIDFTESNIYAVIIWTVKHCNEYFDDQLLEIYDILTNIESMQEYKSNKRWKNDDWRYLKPSKEEIDKLKKDYHWEYKKASKNKSHYWLDYRVIVNAGRMIENYEYRMINGISKERYYEILDVLVVASNLGFKVGPNEIETIQWKTRKKHEIFDKDGVLFAELRLYQKGSMHWKFSQEFMQKLNVEAARLKGWIKSPEDASEELNIPLEEVKKMFRGNIQLPLNNIKLLT